MEYRLRYYGDPVLREKTRDITAFDDDDRKFFKDLTAALYLAEDGVGLAAPQIGVSRSVFVADEQNGNGARIFINPVIVSKSEEQVQMEEGCLSIPEIYENVYRPKSVVLKYFTPEGSEVHEEIGGYLARIVQHEYDHLQGILFVDHLTPVRRKMLRKKLLEIQKMAKEVTESLKHE